MAKSTKSNKGSKTNAIEKSKKSNKLLEKIDMYDMIIASMLDKNNIIETEEKLDNKHLAIGFSNVSTKGFISKYFMIYSFPEFIPVNLYSKIRKRCMSNGVKIDFYTFVNPYVIDWGSSEMINRMKILERYTSEQGEITDFNYRDKKFEIDNKKRIILSTKYLNKAELDYNRKTMRALFIIKVTAKRNKSSILNMAESIDRLKEYTHINDIGIKELHTNMLDWLRAVSPFKMMIPKEVENKLSRKMVTDDILANFSNLRQGRVGEDGVPLGIDILSGDVVLYKYKENRDAPENVMVTGETGSGKSQFMKAILSCLLSSFAGMIIDFEGDEYTNFGNYIKAGKSSDVNFIAMGNGNNTYFDPCPIPDTVGDFEIDNGLKDQAMDYIKMYFDIMVTGQARELDNSEVKIISIASHRLYDSAGVTDDKETWSRSKKLRLSMVYDIITEMVESKEFYNPDSTNSLHNAACGIKEATSLFFESGEIYSHVLERPLGLDKLYNAKLNIFSFGMKGISMETADKKILALKQACVSYATVLISNYNKFVLNRDNFKVWEEAQRWFRLRSSESIIINEITGGRKRGSINFIITNDLSKILRDNDNIGEVLKQNIQSYYVGKIESRKIRESFCKEFDLNNILGDLNKIARDTKKGKKNKADKTNKKLKKYEYAFCTVMPDGSTPIVRAELPKSVMESNLYKKG